jgi:hypothetical protein
MIDTISFTTNARFKSWLGDFTSLPLDWFASARGRLSKDLNTQSMALVCKPIDLRIYRQGPTVTSVGVNLPKLLFGHNGRLIENKSQFELGMQWLDWILRQVLEPNWPNDGFVPGYTHSTPDGHFTRIDLAWQFPASLGLRSALEFARHPKIRSHTSNIRGQTVELRGTLLTIKVYDKLRQMLKMVKMVKSNQPAIDRWEVSLIAKGLAEVYQTHDGLGYSQITWLWIEHTMRKIAAELECTVALVNDYGIAAFIAYLQRKSSLLYFPTMGRRRCMKYESLIWKQNMQVGCPISNRNSCESTQNKLNRRRVLRFLFQRFINMPFVVDDIENLRL